MARTFNGTSDLIAADAAAGFSEQNNYGISCWVNLAASATKRCFYSEGRSTTNNPFIQLENSTVSTNRALIVVRNDAGGNSQINGVLTASAVYDSTPHHFIYTQSVSGSTTTWQVYVDGAADSTAQGTYTNGTTTIDRVGIGCARLASNSGFVGGSVWDVAIFHRTLTAAEAVALASGLPASHLGPDHYWPLWGVDSPEPDLGVASHAAGTLTGTSSANGALVGKELVAI